MDKPRLRFGLRLRTRNAQQPVIYQDKCATTPVSILQTQGLTIGIAPERQFPRKPYLNGENTHAQWNVGYGAMDAEGKLSPLLYYPVLGTPKAALKKGQKLHFAYRIILSKNIGTTFISK